MDPPRKATRKIPRPWLERRQISARAHLMMGSAPVLLDKPNVLKSFLKLGWCCREEAPQEALQQPFYPGSPIILSQRKHHTQDSFDTSSFHRAARPTVIYVIQGDPSQISAAKDVQDKWHESYLSFGSSNSPRSRPTVVNRDSSCDTSFTSLSCEDSLVFSDGYLAAPKQNRQRQPSPSAARPNGIPRPPRVQKSQTAGSVLMRSTPNNCDLKPLSVPPPNRARSATVDSTISTGSRHRRQLFLMDQETVDQTFTMSVDWDNEEDDDSLALRSENSASPIFPLLDYRSCEEDSVLSGKQHVASPRSLDSEKVESELYLPKCNILEDAQKDRTIVLSGWVAYSKGDSLLHKRRLTHKHLGYLVVYADEPNEIYLEQPPAPSSGQGTGEDDTPSETVVIKLPNTNVSIQTEECKGGRSVVICADSEILCTILPTNLPTIMFDATTNKILRPPLPAPVPTFAQHDAALHLWFGLDGWMKGQRMAAHSPKA